MSGIADNIRRIRQGIAAAAAACGRNPADIELIAVSKNFPRESILSAIDAGQRHLAENRVQEAEQKIPSFRANSDLIWHMIGHLQSNKAQRAAELFDVIHSVDSVKLARKLSQAAGDLGKVLSVLIQVDLGHEATKSGVDETQVADMVGEVASLGGLRLDGLMTVPPFFEDPEDARPYFIALREFIERLEQSHPGCLGRRELSMGMSHDYAVAIREGTTMVRIGTSIFGERHY
jgi:pyridoxal phosphate enzyme (YggS family)